MHPHETQASNDASTDTRTLTHACWEPAHAYIGTSGSIASFAGLNWYAAGFHLNKFIEPKRRQSY